MRNYNKFIFLLLLTSNANAQNNTAIPAADDTLIFADTEPEYPGGIEAMNKFIKSNIFYPEESKKNGEQGTVYVQFVIDTCGTIKDVNVLQGVSLLIDEEAVRVISLMPKWKPGTLNGKPCRVSYVVPITFSVQSYSEKKKRGSK